MRRKYLIADTEELVAIDRTSKRLNQGMSDALIESLDPDGAHLMTLLIPHNDHWRTGWLVKVKGDDAPVGPVLIDVPNTNKLDALREWRDPALA